MGRSTFTGKGGWGSFSCQAIHLLGDTESGGQFFGGMEGGKIHFFQNKKPVFAHTYSEFNPFSSTNQPNLKDDLPKKIEDDLKK